MKKFYTRYKLDEQIFSCDIYASSVKKATQLLKKRKLGETIDGPVLGLDQYNVSRDKEVKVPSTMIGISGSSTVEILHAIVHLSDLAVRAGILTPVEVLGDNGILHEYAHYKHFPESLGKSFGGNLLKRLQDIENKVPGYLPK